MDLAKELKALGQLDLPDTVKEQKMIELLKEFFSDEKNVDQIFGVMAAVAVKHDR